MDPNTMYLTAFLIIGGIIFLVLFFHYVPFFLWLSAKVSGVNISLVQLFLMRIRNVPPYIIVPGKPIKQDCKTSRATNWKRTTLPEAT